MSKILRWVLIVLGVLLVIGVVAGVVLSRAGAFGPMMGGRFLRFGFGWGGVPGIILPAVFWAALIGLGIWLIGGWSRSSSHSAPSSSVATESESAIDILKKRYARGEITKEQFDEMKHNLEA
jgi:putative membrane protein